MNNRNIKPISPFIIFCQKVIPLAFDESMSYYECLCALTNYLYNEVTPAVNNNADAVTELQNYVKNYFDNLDVQQEINNKLDEMAEGGQLTDIIAQYLNLAGVLAYNNVNEMKNADNIANGSIAKTLGFHEYNDGGGAYYKIRTITNDDTVDNITIIAITTDNSLIAELIPFYKMSVKCFGAYGDGTHDDTSALQFAIGYNTYGSVYFDKGEYLISAPLKTYVDNSKQCNIEMEKTTVIKANTNISCLIELGGLGGDNTGVIDRERYIKGGILDATNCDYGLKINGDAMGITIKEMEIKNFDVAGLYVPAGDTLYSSDLLIDDCYINGKGSHLTGVGIYLERPDNTILNLRINACKKCIYATKGGQFIRNVHGLGIGNDNWFTGTVFFEMSGGSINTIDNSYCDTLETFIKDTSTDDEASFTITNSTYFSYLSNVDTKLFIITKAGTDYNISNNTFSLPTPSTKNQGIIYNNYDQQYSLKSNNVFIENNIISNSGSLLNGDLLMTTHKRYKPYWAHTDRTLPDDKWLKVGYIIPNQYSFYDLIISLDGQLLNPQFKLERFGTSTYLTYRGGFKTSDTLSIYLGVKYENNTNGIDVYGLYIKTVTTGINENVEVKQQNENVPFIQISTDLIDPTFETLTMDTEALI